MCKPTIFQKTYKDYISQIENINLKDISETIGGVVRNNEIEIPFFKKPYKISSKGILNNLGDTADFSEAAILSKYILLSPQKPVIDNKLVSYPEFKDAGPLTKYFKDNAEEAIAKYFTNNLAGLKTAGKLLKGVECHTIDAAYDFKLKFNPLPRIPIYLLYNDEEKEEGFPAQSVMLFEKSARTYLDEECLAILGTLLFNRLKQIGDTI
ncbi:MAG: DUF3786 domain-containing protein [Deltaproteobacteria bacterium]|nr:DUF3786 domain-containing protein [Deltaproteobacteria bacterium]